MKRNEGLGFMDDLGDYGEWNPIWGFIGGAALTGAAMVTFKALAGRWPTLAKHAGLAGAVLGLAGAGVAMIWPGTRRFGYLMAAGSVLAAAPEVVRAMVLVPRGLGDYDEIGYYEPEFAAPPTPALEILGAPQPPVEVLQGVRGMGYTTAQFAGANLAGW